jgi:hypothetical protein
VNVHWISNVGQIEKCSAEPSALVYRPFESEVTLAKLYRNKLPSSDQILAKLIQTEGEILQSEILKLVNFIWNKEELPEQ